AFTSGGHDFEQNGYLFIAETAEGMAALRTPMPLYARLGVEVELVGPQRIAQLVPGIRTDDLKGGRLGKRDGYGAPLDALAGFPFRPKGGAQRFAMPNLTADGVIEKGPAAAPASFDAPGDALDVPPQLEPWVKARGAWRMEPFADLQITDRWSCNYEMTPDH